MSRGRVRVRAAVMVTVVIASLFGVAGSTGATSPPWHDSRLSPHHVDTLDPIFTEVQSTTKATANGEPVPSCGTGVDHTIWYRFRPTHRMRLDADTNGSDFDTVLQVYVATESGLRRVACNDDHVPPGRTSRVTIGAAAGRLYYFQLGGYAGASGTAWFTLLGIPWNDAFSRATTVGSLGRTFELDTTYATTQSGEPARCGVAANTVWFRYVPSVDTTVTVDTLGSAATFDTVVNVYRGNDLGSLVFVACNDDGGRDFHSRVSWLARAGRSYYIQVLGVDSSESGPLNVTFTRG